MARKRWVLISNGILTVVLLAAASTGIFAVASASSSSGSTTRTATVSRGNVTATVSASGNVSAQKAVGVNFTSSGTVTDIYVAVGQQVAKGQALAKIDDTKARQSLASAQASLAQAQASYSTTTQGQSSEQAARDQAQVDAAQVSLNNAKTNLANTDAINSQKVQTAQQTLTADQNQQSIDCAGSGSTGTACAQDTQKVAADQQNLQSIQLQAQQSNAQAQGQVDSAQASLNQAKASAAADAAPARPGAIASAQAQVNSAKVQVQSAQSSLDDTSLKAPIDGTVVSISGSVGGSSSASSSSGSSSSSSAVSGFIVVEDLSRLQVTTLVAEADASKVAFGQAASVSFSAINKTVTGTVAAMDVAQTVSNNVVEYGVTVTLDSSASEVRLGQTASVRITTGTRQNVLTVPSSAVTTVGGSSTVTVLKDGRQSIQRIEIGLVGDTLTEVTTGLSEGQVVVLPTGSGGGGAGFTFPTGGLGGGLGAGAPGGQ